MPPKKSTPTKAESKAKADNVDEPILQAVILADSYNRRFEVLCQDVPRMLLPLCSTPLLAWTLESLSLSKVKQVFIFCGAHADKIKDFVEASPYRFTLDIQCLSAQNAVTAGDAMRALDDMHVLDPDNPFILVHSPLISNYDLSQAVEAHKARREVDKSIIMTITVAKGGRAHPESTVMLVHPPSSRLLHYIPHPLSPSQHRASFPASLFLDPYPTDIDTYEIWSGTSSSSSSRGGYRDVGVDVCEADVPALCTENFDYHDLRRHLLNGVLTSELLGKRVSVHLVGDEDDAEDGKQGAGRYINRVRDTRTFGEISRDVLRRWAFPLAPDLNEPGGVQYEPRPGNVYVAMDNVVLSRTTALDGPLLIGPRSALAHNTHVILSTLGADCTVGPNTFVNRSYIFDDVRIGAHCRLEECMIGRGVEIADGAKIGRGALIGNGVKLGRGADVPSFARVAKERYSPDEGDEDGQVSEETEAEREERLKILGQNATGYLWPTEEEELPEDSDDDGDDPFEDPRNKRLSQLGRTLSNITSSTDSLSTLSKASSSPAESLISLASSASLPEMPTLSLDTGPPPAFHAEASASLARAFEEGHAVENALLELRTLVMGYNAGVDRAREEVMSFLMSKIEPLGAAATVLSSATAIFARWGALATNLSTEASNIALDAQKYCVEHDELATFFPMILRALYEADLLGEEELVEWRSLSTAKGAGAKDEEERSQWMEVYLRGKIYVDVLEEMDSEDDEEDEEKDEEDEA